MPIAETDVDLLEEYLDGALDVDTVAMLQNRLATDQGLSAELKFMRAQREIRQAALQSMQPDAATVERFVWRVRGAMFDQQQKQVQLPHISSHSLSQWRIARIGSAAAACLVLGFFAGRIGHNGSAIRDTPSGLSGMVLNTTGSSPIQPEKDDQAASQFTALNHTPQFSVPVTNEYGQVVAWQHFDNSEQAKNFTEELHRAHGETPSAASGSSVKLVDHEEQVPF